VLPLGESSKSAERPRNEGELVIRDSTIDGPRFGGLRGVSEGNWGGGLFTILAWDFSCGFGPGDASGDSDGNDSSVLADVGVTSDCFREPARPVPVLRDDVEIWDAVRSSLPLSPPRLAMPLGWRARSVKMAYQDQALIRRLTEWCIWSSDYDVLSV